MAVAYSQFGCDDSLLYAAYLATHYGECGDNVVARRGIFNSLVGRVTGREVGGGCYNDSAVVDVAAVCGFSQVCVGGVPRCSKIDCECGACVGVDTGGRKRESGGVPGGESFKCGSTSSVSACDRGPVVVDERVESSRGAVELGLHGRGPNWSRNKLNRDKQKRRKASRQERGFDWRKRSDKQEIVHLKNGFFSDCPQNVQTQLKESRARLLIAENLRKEQEERRKIDKMNSPEQIFLDAMEMVDFAGKAAKKANDSKVAGWVQTVASSRAESIAKSAPSSVPSFESVSEKLEESAATSVSAREILLEEKLSQAYSENSDLKNKLGRLSLEKRSAVEEAETLLQKKYDAVVNRVRELESASVEQSVREYAVLPSRRGFFG